MNRLYKKLITAFSFVLLIVSMAHACGPSLYLNEGRFSLFRNGLDGYEGLEPFYFSESFLNSYIPDPAGFDYRRNCEEWRKYCDSNISIEDIFQMQYKADADTFLKALASNDWRRFGSNTFLKWLQQPKHKEAYDYFILSKRVEFTQFGDKDPWHEGDNVQFMSMDDCHKKLVELSAATKDKFLRERYAFQALKMEYYVYGTETIPSFEPHALPLYKKYLINSKSVVAGWAALFYGLMQKDNNLRTFYLLKAFDLSEEKKVFCYNHLSKDDMNKLLASVKDKKTMELIYAVQGMKTYGKAFAAIQKLYKLNPQSKYLPLLISREINKLEDWIWSPELLHFSTLGLDDDKKVKRERWNRNDNYHDPDVFYFARLNLVNDINYLKKFRGFVSNMKMAKYKSFTQLATAHLYNITKNYDSALLCLNRMPKQNDTSIETQKIIEWSIATAYTHNVLDAEFKNQLLHHLKKLNALNPAFSTRDTTYSFSGYEYEGSDTNEAVAEKNDDFGELLLMLSNRFLEKGDIVTAGLLYNKANITANIYDGCRDDSLLVSYKFIAYFDRNASVATMDSLLRFIGKQNKTAFEQFICPKKWAKEDFYKDLKGTILVRQQKFKEALDVFEDIDSDFWNVNYEYANYLPKKSITSLGTMAPWADMKPIQYDYCNKAFILNDITQIQDSLKMNKLSNSQKALLHYRLGNCLYNITYFGKAWMMESYGKTDREETNDKGYFAYYSFYPNNIKYGKNYYGCEAAMKEYKLALNITSDKEMKIWALLNLNLCENISFYYKSKKKPSAYLATLNKYYSKSETFQNASAICPGMDEHNYY